MKFTILIYGCQMNYSDSARMKSVLTNGGFEYVDTIQEADIVIFDTCSVRQKSEDKVFGKIKEINKQSKDKKIWITGCMVQHNLKLDETTNEKNKTFKVGNFIGDIKTSNPSIVGLEKNVEEEVDTSEGVLYVNHMFDPLYSKINEKSPNVELFFRIDDLPFLPKVLKELGYDVKNEEEVSNEYVNIVANGSNQSFSENTKTAFVPIQTGCNQFCAYCIVPFSRGLEKNRSKDEVLSEVKYHLDNGMEEIVLIGQIVNKHPEFNQIIKEILQFPGLRWLRYTSPYPTYYDEELFKLHENEEKLCPHIHIPVQSGSDKVLKKMFRGYTSDQFKGFIDGINSLNRDISITTDIIVGFCDETEEDFQKTLDITEYSAFDMIYMGVYSTRPGTIAARKYEDNIPQEEKKKRWSDLNSLLRKISYSNNEKEVGNITDVMITDIKDDVVIGYNEKMKNVILEKPTEFDFKEGDFVKAEITVGGVLKLDGKIL